MEDAGDPEKISNQILAITCTRCSLTRVSIRDITIASRAVALGASFWDTPCFPQSNNRHRIDLTNPVSQAHLLATIMPASQPARPAPPNLNRLARGILALALIPIAGYSVHWITTLLVQNPQPETHHTLLSFQGTTMGTTYSIKAVTKGDQQTLDVLGEQIEEQLKIVNHQMSTYLDDSELSLFNASESTDWFDVSPETAHVTQLALDLAEDSQGAFDPTIGPLVNLWSFGPEKRPENIPTDDEITARRAYVGYQRLHTRKDPPALKKDDPRVSVDLSAIAKGHGVDQVALFLESQGIVAYLVEIGGEVRVKGEKRPNIPWNVAVQKPVVSTDHLPGSTDIQKLVPLKDASLATSGDYHNFFEHEGRRFSHTIDPQTGRPITHMLTSVSVISPTCAQADGIATALMVMGPERGFQWALDRNLPVYMIVKQAERFQERLSPQFQSILNQ